ncbi:hypothetical protein ALP17_04530 [Pseudomonas savastanoi]|uniref:Uncharacterized protein n=1 Tax=Pseudomonas savastanoi TaxID=29438 RepID=A0A3M6A1K2_PSESS|nr:hypothetical protein ALP17_04530 [Pseudomonas savastanoi]
MRNDHLDYRAALCVACSSGRSASGLERAARRRFVTRSVTHGIPTLEREERSPHYRAARRSASHAVLDALRPILSLRCGADL